MMTISPVAWAKAGPHGRPFAAVSVVQDDPQVFAAVDRRQRVPRAVRATVVDEDDFLGDGHLADAADDLGHRGLLVVDRDDHGDAQPLGQRIDSQLAAHCLAEETFPLLTYFGIIFWSCHGLMAKGKHPVLPMFASFPIIAFREHTARTLYGQQRHFLLPPEHNLPVIRRRCTAGCPVAHVCRRRLQTPMTLKGREIGVWRRLLHMRASD